MLADAGDQIAHAVTVAVVDAPRAQLVGLGVHDRAHGVLGEHLVDGLLDGFPDQLAQFVFHGLLVERYDWVGHGLPPSMIEFDTQIIPTARAMSFLFSGRVQLSKCAKNFTLPTLI